MCKSLWLILLLVAGPVYAAGTEGKADSPTEVCRKMIEAIKRAAFDTAAKFVGEECRAEEEKSWAAFRRAGEAEKRRTLETLKKVKIECVREVIDGDQAAVLTIITRDGGKREEHWFGFKRIGGEWKALGYSEGLVVTTRLLLKGAPPDAVVREYIRQPFIPVSVMLCGGEKKRDLEAAHAENGDWPAFNAKEIRELAESSAGGLDLRERTEETVELESIDGDLATVKVRRLMSGEYRTGRMYLRKFDGEWKIVWKDEYDRTKAAGARR